MVLSPDPPIAASDPEDLLLVGRVARAHGNRGQVIVNLETDFPEERFAVGQVLYVDLNGPIGPRRIESVRFQQGRPVIRLAGVETMDAAEALAGAELKVAASALAPLPAGTFYRHDLVGCDVRDVHDRTIGRVTAVEGPMERSHLVIAAPRGEVLIPLVAEICRRIDPAGRTIVVEMPEGLLDLNDRGAAE